MMRDTPRAFVGTVVFRLGDPPDAAVREAVERRIGTLPGVSLCHVDDAAGLLVVTARAPVERAAVLAVLDQLHCRVAQ